MVEYRVVYFDKDVRVSSGNWIGGTWIGLDNAERIARYFEEKNFERKDSDGLGRWMNHVTSHQECDDTIVVFAQDIAPYDVFDDFSSHALVRQYLDNGGTILWMGDVPFFYRTEWRGGHFELNDFMDRSESKYPVRRILSHIDILGVIPVTMIASSRFSITRKGYKYGLKSAWASARPIIIPSILKPIGLELITSSEDAKVSSSLLM